jgi:predicted secreted protein with PEFG-CTERM motif
MNQCYVPYEITIQPGDEVVWSNDDTAAHTVTSGTPTSGPDGNFDSSLFMAAATFSHIFDSAGEFPYFCMVHPWMSGSITVNVPEDSQPSLEKITIGSGMSDSDTVSSESSIKVLNTDIMMKYEITNGKVVGIFPDVNANSLVVKTDINSAGDLTLELPRSLIDAKIGNSDDIFFTLVDGEEVDYEESMTDTHRTLTIPFTEDTEEIEIIGTFVVPEFGTIAIVILAAAIVSIIVLSTKSRLGITQRQ